MPVKGAALPGLLFPADGRMAEVRTGFVSCVLCDADAPVTLERIQVKDGRSWRAARPEEVEVGDPGGRRLLLRSTPEAVYALQYSVGGREVAFDVVAREAPSRYPAPFWLPAATARGAPSPATAGGS